MKPKYNAKSRPDSVEKTQNSRDSHKSQGRARFEESSIEKDTSKGSWSKLIKTELEILEELKSPGTKSVKQGKDLEVLNILLEMKNLREENKILKQKLAKRNERPPKTPSRRRKDEFNLEKEPGGRLKHCKMCAKLLSKGYTTRFCPTHGHFYKVNS